MTPTEIKYRRADRVLSVTFDDAHYDLSAEFLRVYSLETGKRGVGIRAIEPVGNYAVRLVFDDGHDSGLYSWATLAEFGRDHARLWQDYLDRVARAGASRDL